MITRRCALLRREHSAYERVSQQWLTPPLIYYGYSSTVIRVIVSTVFRFLLAI